MRKFKVTMRGKSYTVTGGDANAAKELVKEILGLSGPVCCQIREYYNGNKTLEKRLKNYIKKTGRQPEIETWHPTYLNESEKLKPRESHIEIPRVDGYFDSIYFEIGQEEIMMEVKTQLDNYFFPGPTVV